MVKRSSLPRGKETVLLVDDDAFVLESARRMLKELGYTVLSAASGREAIEIADENALSIDVILLDKRMPGFSGHETFGPLQAIVPRAKIVIISGKGFDTEDQPLLEAGAVTVIEKPLRVSTLAPLMRAVIDHS